MAQPASSPKIEELRFRLKTDPKSRLFYQLAEELRRAGGAAESEQVLRSGLSIYPTYLAAWVSLGRVLRELKNEDGAVEALSTALQLDPGNVVAARLLADAHLALGDKLEAIKKYKLVHALMPGDEELKATIEALARELHPPQLAPEPVLQAEPAIHESDVAAGEAGLPVAEASFFEGPLAGELQPEESPFDKTMPPFDQGTRDLEPMRAEHEESPFEEPAGNALLAVFELEHPTGMHIEEEPAPAGETSTVEVPGTLVFDEARAEASQGEELTDTSTMADLYARQGLHNEARNIYENVLARDPGNEEVRAKLDAITPRVNPSIDRLERWLAKVSRKQVGSV